MKKLWKIIQESEKPNTARIFTVITVLALLICLFRIINVNLHSTEYTNPDMATYTSYLKSQVGLETFLTLGFGLLFISVWMTTLVSKKDVLKDNKIWQLAFIIATFSIMTIFYTRGEIKQKENLVALNVENMWLATQGYVEAQENPKNKLLLKKLMYNMQVNAFQHTGLTRESSENRSKFWIDDVKPQDDIKIEQKSEQKLKM